MLHEHLAEVKNKTHSFPWTDDSFKAVVIFTQKSHRNEVQKGLFFLLWEWKIAAVISVYVTNVDAKINDDQKSRGSFNKQDLSIL